MPPLSKMVFLLEAACLVREFTVVLSSSQAATVGVRGFVSSQPALVFHVDVLQSGLSFSLCQYNTVKLPVTDRSLNLNFLCKLFQDQGNQMSCFSGPAVHAPGSFNQFLVTHLQIQYEATYSNAIIFTKDYFVGIITAFSLPHSWFSIFFSTRHPATELPPIPEWATCPSGSYQKNVLHPFVFRCLIPL